MRISLALALPVIAWVGCSSGAGPSSSDGLGNGMTDGGGHDISQGQDGTLPPGDVATTAPESGNGPPDSGMPDGSAHDTSLAQDGTAPPGDAATTASDARTMGQAGNPNGSCSAGIPAKGQPADIANPTAVVGTGTAASCTFSQLQAAVAQGGVITFNCGSGAVTIPISATLNLPTNKNTVIDGGNKVTLDGGQAVQILSFNSPNFRANDNGLTLQHIALINGKKTPSQAIPSAPAPCSQGWNDGEGGALYMRDGNLTVIDSIFTNNQAAPLGPDTGGGAIYVLGSKNGALIVGSTFSNNTASNAGAVGGLFTELDIYNSLFTGNTASGHDANSNEPTKCSAMNNGQNETGSGGNGGAIYSDGNSVNITLCGDAILNNSAGTNAFGGGLFFTSDDMIGTLTITDSTMTGNTGGHWTTAATGSVMSAGTAVGVNAKSITVTNSTLQGYP
ncbi:MAG: hypothetical protein M3O46_01405 [Myxococcota bacterium]|nr:hypothetical protein [Myxococcota bacterium]